MNKNWNEFRNKVQSQLVVDELTPMILVFGFTTEVGNIFESINKELVTKENYQDEVIDSLSEMLWTIAALEIAFQLPASLYSNYIDTPITENPDHGLNLLDLQSDLTRYISTLSTNIREHDLDEVQYNINKLLVSLYNILIYYNINPLTVLNDGMKKVNGGDEPKDYQKEFDSSLDALNKDSSVVVLDIKIDRRRKNPFKGVYMTSHGKDYKFTTGDVITDFFSASNTLYSIFKGKSHSVNYSPKFREYLDIEKTDIETGFIIGNDLFSIQDLLKKEKVVDGVMTISDKARPVLLNSNLDTIDKLLDHVLEVRNKK